MAENKFQDVAVVAIGRNEGERLRRCLESIAGRVAATVYVDSGSTDGSVKLARAMGVEVVELDRGVAFTAARARNAGLHSLLRSNPDIKFVQMIDGDCELRGEWLEAALAAIEPDSSLALVFGRRRERYPERSVYNAHCDDEWNIPVGEAAGCGGDVLFRLSALKSVGAYNEKMIAGEDSELSMRLRKQGWKLRRIDSEMTWHDANILSFGQYWQRAKRSGYAYAEMAHLHPDARWPDWPRACRSIAIWGGIMPLATIAVVLLALLYSPNWLAVLVVALLPWPAKIAQLALRQEHRGLPRRTAWANGVLLMLGKLPQFLGLARFHIGRLNNHPSAIIEYKGPSES